MLSTIRLAALSAVLAGVVVSTLWTSEGQSAVPSTTKIMDRLPQGDDASLKLGVAELRPTTEGSAGKGDRIASAQTGSCKEAAWPYVPQKCLTLVGAAEPRSSIRMITVEERQGENTSILVRLPQISVAAR